MLTPIRFSSSQSSSIILSAFQGRTAGATSETTNPTNLFALNALFMSVGKLSEQIQANYQARQDALSTRINAPETGVFEGLFARFQRWTMDNPRGDVPLHALVGNGHKDSTQLFRNLRELEEAGLVEMRAQVHLANEMMPPMFSEDAVRLTAKGQAAFQRTKEV